MAKKYYTAILLLFCFVRYSWSTWSRVYSLGATFWMLEQDDTLLWLNPAEVSNFPNTILAEVGTASGSTLQPNVDGNLRIGNQWGGVIFNTHFLYPGTLAVFFARPYWGLVTAAGHQAVGSDVASVPSSPLGTPMLPRPLYNKLDLFWSSKIGKYPLGISVFLASNSSNNSSTNTTWPFPSLNDVKYTEKLFSSEIWVMLGTKLKQLYIFDNVDAVLNIGLHKVDNFYIDQQYDGNRFVVNDNYNFTTEGLGSIELTLRGITRPHKDVAIVSLFDYHITDLTNKFIRKTDTNLNGVFLFTENDVYYRREQEYINNFITLSCATNIYFFKKVLWIIGTSIFINNLQIEERRRQLLSDRYGVDQEYNYERLILSIPLYLSCEYNIYKFLTLRGGINKVVYAIETIRINDPDYDSWDGSRYPLKNLIETETKRDLTSDYTTNISLGAQVKLGERLYIDAVLRQNVLFTGSYLISGVPETLISQISVMYKF